LLWEQLAGEFDLVNDIAMHQSVADESEEEVDNEKDARIGELERLLTVGQEMSAEELERVLAGVERMHALCSMSCAIFNIRTTARRIYSAPRQKRNTPAGIPPKKAHGRWHSRLDLGCHGGSPRRIARCL
jgi:hypothetical protein